MAGIRFTQEQRNLLALNPNIKKVTDKSITYAETFKLFAIDEYAKGKTPHEIFKNAGIDPSIIGSKNPARCLGRWRISYFKDGSSGLMGERRGTSNSGRPVTSELSLEEKLKLAEAKIAYLEMENEFLKKLEELERRMNK